MKLLKNFWMLLIIPFGLIFDQITKALAVSNLADGSIEVIRDFFYWTLTFNSGAAWSSFDGQKYFLIAVSSIASIGMMIYFFRVKNNYEKIALAMLITGALGNLYDRIFCNGLVTDFINFYIFGYDFPVFNVADIFVTLGAILLGITFIMNEIKEKKHE